MDLYLNRNLLEPLPGEVDQGGEVEGTVREVPTTEARLDAMTAEMRELYAMVHLPQGSRFRGMVKTELELTRLTQPRPGDMAFAEDTGLIFIYTSVGWQYAHTPGQPSQALAAGTTLANAVTTVPTESGLIASTGKPDEVKVAADTGGMFRWTAGLGWKPISADITLLQSIITQLQKRVPMLGQADIDKVLTATGPGTAAWKPLPKPPAVTFSDVAGVTPLGPPAMPGAKGDIFVNTGDHVGWVRGDAFWERVSPEVPISPTIYFESVPGKEPGPTDMGVVGSVFVNTVDDLAWIKGSGGWARITPPRAAKPGLVLTSRAGAAPEWAPPVESAVLAGVVTAAAGDPHEWLWSDLGVPTKMSTLRNGSYLVVGHVEADKKVPAGVPGIAGLDVAVGDWIVAIDSDGNGAVDTYHLSPHDVQSIYPPMVGHNVGESLLIKDPATGEVEWKLVTGNPDNSGIGTINAFPTLTIPPSHLLCDGATFDKVKYPELFRVLGSDKLPDLRDKFVRGWSAARAPLNEQGQATAKPTTPFTADSAGTHHHVIGIAFSSGGAARYAYEDGASRDSAVNTDDAGAHTHTVSGGDAETRPANTAVVYAIQAKPLTVLTRLKPAPPVVGWGTAAWPKDSVVVEDGLMWRALVDIPATDGPPAEPKWESVGSKTKSGWEVLESWDAVADGTKSFTPDWAAYSDYVVALNCRNAVFTKSASGLTFTGVQTSHLVGGSAYSGDMVANTERQVVPDSWMFRGEWQFSKDDAGLDFHLHTDTSENIVVRAGGPAGLTGAFTVRWVGAGSGSILGLRRA